MKYDSVLDQQSISGKIVSLILCVWKPCYVKSGHIWYASLYSLIGFGKWMQELEYIITWLKYQDLNVYKMHTCQQSVQLFN